MKKMSKVSVLGAMIALVVSMMPMSAFAYTTPLVDGAVYAIQCRLSGKVLDVNGSATWNGAGVIQWDYYGGKNQQWRASDQGDGFYKFININSGKMLEVPGGNYTKGTQLVQWQNTTSNGQKWGLEKRDYSVHNDPVFYIRNFYTIHNKMSGQVVNDAGQSTQNGTWIIQWPLNHYSEFRIGASSNWEVQEFSFERKY